MELGAKIAFIKETKHFPQIGSFTMFEMPTGNFDKGLGVGKVWYKLPIWLQKKPANGSLTAAAATRSFRRPATATSPTPAGSSSAN
jgi:hypothetical protein